MGERAGPLYEVTHTLDPDITSDFDVWLAGHIEEMLAVRGIAKIETFVSDADGGDRPRRITVYHFESDSDLEDYFAGPAATLRKSAEDNFGDRFTVERRILQRSCVVDGNLQPVAMCLNCGTTLAGQYCGNCGQRANSRLISLWELIRDAFGDLFELDSRIWRTLIPLVTKPGQLTRDYLEGRRARFMPPFRTYLVLSIVFFLVAFFDPREEFGILFSTPQDGSVSAATDIDGAQESSEAFNLELTDAGVVVAGTPGDAQDNDNDEARDALDDCASIEAEDWQAWAPPWLTPTRVRAVCERVVADDGKAFSTKLLDNVPAALIALLPLMALALKLLYPLSKRYYVEHVLFVVHFHAFVFFVLTLQIVFTELTTLVGLPNAVGPVTSVAVAFYIPIYFFKALRKVYRQSWAATLVKYLALLLAYTGGLVGILLTTAVFSAFAL